jgi:hypothetical protein
MTGTILSLASAGYAGTIKSGDGSRLLFSAAAVLGDLDALAVGHYVSFDVEHDGPRRRAVRVFHEPVRRPAPSKRTDGAPDLRYAGFHHTAGVRVYHFELLTVGQTIDHAITLDLNLLLKHHIGVQEVPGLCANKLIADLKSDPSRLLHRLDDNDLRQFAAARSAALERKSAARHAFHIRRGPAPPGPPATRGLG